MVNELEHHGVKGQKWGVTRKREQSPTKIARSNRKQARRNLITKQGKEYDKAKTTAQQKALDKKHDAEYSALRKQQRAEKKADKVFKKQQHQRQAKLVQTVTSDPAYQKAITKILNDGAKKGMNSNEIKLAATVVAAKYLNQKAETNASGTAKDVVSVLVSNRGDSYISIKTQPTSKLKHEDEDVLLEYYIVDSKGDLQPIETPSSVDELKPAEELNHHGILGQKWGIRRTPAQLARAGKKSAKNMSDDELNKKVRRLELERRYNSLQSSEKSAAKTFASNVIKNAASQVATEFVKNVAANALNATINKAALKKFRAKQTV